MECNDAVAGFCAVEIDTFTDSPGVNQDRFVVTPVPRGMLVVMCDGAGNSVAAGRAAGAVVREIVVRHEHMSLADLERHVSTMDTGLARARPWAETTCVALWVTEHEVYGVSTGDSEAWWVGPDDELELTRDQPRGRLGSGNARVRSFRRLREGGRVVVGTYGLFKYAQQECWVQLARTQPTENLARRLVTLARLPNGRLQDDATGGGDSLATRRECSARSGG